MQALEDNNTDKTNLNIRKYRINQSCCWLELYATFFYERVFFDKMRRLKLFTSPTKCEFGLREELMIND
jgi:hypothetical protein